MPARIEAPITPRVFAWARDSAGYTVADVAKRVGRPAEVVEQWEKGEARPTFSQAKQAAEMFLRPVATLFLSAPMEERALKNFRILSDAGPSPQCPPLCHFSRRVVDRCEWAAAARKGRGESPRAFVGGATLRDNPVELAGRIREQLKIEPGALSGGKKAGRNALVERIRGAGVFVFTTDNVRGRKVPIEGMRGLAVCEPLAPAVAYNRDDFGAGPQIFTLAHEMVHVWLGEEGEGISVDWPLRKGKGNRANVERFCNLVAGEVLMPRERFRELWRNATDNAGNLPEKKLEEIARFFCVSRDAAAYQAATHKLIGWDVYDRLHRKYKSAAQDYRENLRLEREKRKERGEKFYPRPRAESLLAQSGWDFASLVLSAYYDGDLRPMEAAGLLGARRHEHVDAIAREILG